MCVESSLCLVYQVALFVLHRFATLIHRTSFIMPLQLRHYVHSTISFVAGLKILFHKPITHAQSNTIKTFIIIPAASGLNFM